MKKIALLLLAVILGLAACQPAGTALPSPTPLPPTPAATKPPAATATLPPAATATKPPTPTATATQPASAPDQPAQLSAAQRCDLLPGLLPCSSTALPFSGKVALIAGTADAPTLVVGDFKAGASWWIQKLPAAVSALKWAPSGKSLAVFYAGDKAETYLAEGSLSASANLAPSAVWSAQDQLTAQPFPQAVAANGDRAWIDFNTNTAYIQPAAASAKQVTWPLESGAQPSGKMYIAVSWVPGTSLLLVLSYFPGNSAMLTGGQLAILDTQTGKLKDLPANARLTPQYQWHPTEKGTLVLAESGTGAVMGDQRLLILNVISGQKQYLIDNVNVSAAWPIYTPDGKSVLFAATLPAEQAGPGHPYNALAIYRITVASGIPERLTTPPANFQDQAPLLLPDGVHFLYYRLSIDPAAPRQLSLRLGALDGSTDAALTAPIQSPPCFALPADCNWGSVIAVSY